MREIARSMVYGRAVATVLHRIKWTTDTGDKASWLSNLPETVVAIFSWLKDIRTLGVFLSNSYSTISYSNLGKF